MITKILLENFRNHGKYLLELEKTTVLVGKNGTGKTNILEAITLISFGRSFREEDRKRLIKFESDWARVTLSAIDGGTEEQKNKETKSKFKKAYNSNIRILPRGTKQSGDIATKPFRESLSSVNNYSAEHTYHEIYEIFMQKHPRLITQIKHRGVVKRMSQIVGLLPCVVFSPETLEIITGEPSLRRRFLDIAISQIDHVYLKNLNAYTKVRRQRNKLLERVNIGIAAPEELNYWDEQLANYGDEITKKRYEAVELLNEKICGYYQTISGDPKAKLTLEYHAKAGAKMLLKLQEHRYSEISAKNTLFGPHRDDLVFKLNGNDMAHYASRGEIRSAILSLKVSELDFIESSRLKNPELYDLEIKPILLLDDIYSEFDSERREHLAKLIANYQSLITTTDMEHLGADLQKKAAVVRLN